jgi:murein DD-endopeptidase MepM/ murein hydrolase activator NlpD
MFMPSGTNLIVSAALAFPLATGLAATATVAPAIANTADVAELAKDAKQAQTKLSEAKKELTSAEKALAKAEKARKKAAKGLSKAEAAAEDARDEFDTAQSDMAELRTSIEAAASDVEATRRDEGVVDIAAQAADAINGESDSSLLSTAGGLVTAGVTSVLGPAVQLLKPIGSAANDWIDEADQAQAHAEEREQALRLYSLDVTQAERDATMALVQADWKVAEANASLRAAKKAEKKAAGKQDEAAEAETAAEKAEKKAMKKLREAEEVAEAEAEAKKMSEEREKAAESSSRASAEGRTTRPATGSITSRFGMRTHPITGVHKLHSGTDFSIGDGKAYAARSGTVSAVTYDGAYGNMVTLSHGGGIETRYAHLASATVSVGQSVSAGSVVGNIGSTGYSTGPHLHFEVLQNGEFINPERWLGL